MKNLKKQNEWKIADNLNDRVLINMFITNASLKFQIKNLLLNLLSQIEIKVFLAIWKNLHMIIRIC